MPTSPTRLGDYLRVRRESLKPEDVGLAVGIGSRRVPGLRREEVAVLAGISTEYYLRLEQGRDRHPSLQVLDALARALRLDTVAAAYMFELARPQTAQIATPLVDQASEATQWLIDSWPFTAAVVHNRYVDVIASNALARSLNPNFRPGVNGILSLLMDPWEREFHADWEALASRSVALLRLIADTRDEDPRLASLVADATAGSELFGRFWETHSVHHADEGVHELHHPEVGALSLRFARIPLARTEGQSIFLYFAEPDTAHARAMERLSSTA